MVETTGMTSTGKLGFSVVWKPRPADTNAEQYYVPLTRSISMPAQCILTYGCLASAASSFTSSASRSSSVRGLPGIQGPVLSSCSGMLLIEFIVEDHHCPLNLCRQDIEGFMYG